MSEKKYRAAVMHAPNTPLVVEERPAPELEPGACLLETMFSEVCGTDVHLFHGRLRGVPYPLIPGHVSVGRLAEIRAPAPRDLEGVPYQEGDVVAFLDVHETCGACFYCLVAKETTRCPSRRVYGITYGAEDGLLGGWAERIWLKPGGGCGLNTALHAVDRATVRLGDAVVVLGAGPVGQSIAAFASLSGAESVTVIGAPADRLVMARRMGATHTIGLELDRSARLEAVRALTGGRGADVVIEAAGDPRAVVDGAELCRDGGTLVVAGQYTDNGPVEWNVHELLNKKHLDVRGCWGSDFSHFHRASALMARHQDRFPWSEIVTKSYRLEETNAALAAVESREVLKAAIIP